jgi:hypothetical protein
VAITYIFKLSLVLHKKDQFIHGVPDLLEFQTDIPAPRPAYHAHTPLIIESSPNFRRMSSHSLRDRAPDLPRGPTPKQKFTEQEDLVIMEMANRMPIPDWGLIARQLRGRSARQCRERWRMYLRPLINTGPWTPEEDDILEREFAEQGPKWAGIALFLPGRTEIHLKNRWSKLSRERGKSRKKQPVKHDREIAQPKGNRPQLPPISQLCAESNLWIGASAGILPPGDWVARERAIINHAVIDLLGTDMSSRSTE